MKVLEREKHAMPTQPHIASVSFGQTYAIDLNLECQTLQ